MNIGNIGQLKPKKFLSLGRHDLRHVGDLSKPFFVAIGCSATKGDELNYDDCWVKQLANKLNLEHINLGFTGASLEYQLDVYQKSRSILNNALFTVWMHPFAYRTHKFKLRNILGDRLCRIKFGNKLDDIDTKPGMMRILAKRVNEVEKQIAKETRKQNEGKMSDIDADIKTLSDEEFMKKYKKSKEQMKKDLNESGIMYRAGVKKYGKKGMTAIQSAAGKGASHQEIGKIKDKYLKDAELDEGIKDWAKGLMAAGVIVGAVAGMGSINNAIDNSVPAVKAMNNACLLYTSDAADE